MATSGVELKALGVRLQAAGNGGLRRNLLAGIRAGAAPLVGDVRQAALEKLPKSGGLAEFVASSPIAVRTRLTGLVGVRIVNTRAGARKGGQTDFGTDRGHVRHPTFGRPGKNSWVGQNVTPGWFSKTLEERSPETTPLVLAAMEATAAEVCRLGF
jgi:hypothetical protein